MSKYEALWEYVKSNAGSSLLLTFEEINNIIGFPMDHSFLTFKNELIDYGYHVAKISLKDNIVIFEKNES